MPELVALTLADDPQAWGRAGFSVDEEGTCRIGSVDVRIRPVTDGGGVLSWTLDLDSPVGSIDGITTEVGTVGDAVPGEHANGAVAFDHVVVMTPDLDRTVADL